MDHTDFLFFHQIASMKPTIILANSVQSRHFSLKDIKYWMFSSDNIETIFQESISITFQVIPTPQASLMN